MDDKLLEERVLREVSGEWAVMSLKYLISQKINVHVNNFRLYNSDHSEELVDNSPISRMSEMSHSVVLADKTSAM